LAALVRQVVTRTIGRVSHKEIVGEEDIRQLQSGTEFTVPANTLVTPLARQLALEKGILLIEVTNTTSSAAIPISTSSDSLLDLNQNPSGQRTVAFGADHGGYELKEDLVKVVNAMDYDVVDCGTNSKESVDYPDFAFAVARLVAEGRAWRGIIIDGAGIGSCMAANKVPGVRAALCYDQATAVNSREHNNANVLTLGAGLIGTNLARQIVKTWLETPFGGGRHARRVDKIDAIGQRYMKK